MENVERSDSGRRREPCPGDVNELIEGWDLTSTVRRMRTRLGWSPAYCLEVEREYRRFIRLVVAQPNHRLGMCGPVDELWHEHILDTVDYVSFCHEACGNYLHHVPRASRDDSGSSYLQTLALLREWFGEINWRVWPSPDSAASSCCSQCTHGDIAPSKCALDLTARH
jgi:hypothetical protein